MKHAAVNKLEVLHNITGRRPMLNLSCVLNTSDRENQKIRTEKFIQYGTLAWTVHVKCF